MKTKPMTRERLRKGLEQLPIRLLRLRKGVQQRLGPAPSEPRAILFILGCQRSGTTLMTRIFERDLRSRVFGEFSPLSSMDRPKGLRLNPLPVVEESLARERAPLVVLKPLVESQNALDLLERFPEARVLWMYRDVRDVASSNLRHFGAGNGIDDIRPIAEGRRDSWRSEGASEEVQATIARFYSESMDPYDAAALFWYARNRLFFELGLDRHPRVRMCRYTDLVQKPHETTAAVYDFLRFPYPKRDIVTETHTQSLGKGRQTPLGPEVEALCRDLMARLDACNAERSVLAR